MIKTRTRAPPCWPRCRCRPPSTARRTPSPTPTAWGSPHPCSTWGWPPCPTSLLGSWRPTSHQGRFIIFSFSSHQLLDITCYTSLTSVLMLPLAGMSSLMSSSFAAMTPFSGQAYTQLTASAKWGTSWLQSFSLHFLHSDYSLCVSSSFSAISSCGVLLYCHYYRVCTGGEGSSFKEIIFQRKNKKFVGLIQ